VYATHNYGLELICTLDELRFVAGMLSCMHIARVTEVMDRLCVPNYNGNATGMPSAMQELLKNSAAMMEVLVEGQSQWIHVAGVLAFFEALPYSPRVTRSAPQCDALLRLARVGECIKRTNIFEFKGDTHRMLDLGFTAGLGALQRAGHKLRSQDDLLIGHVLSKLQGTPAVLVLDKDLI